MGMIMNYKVICVEVSFVFMEVDWDKFGVVVIVVGIVGLGGLVIVIVVFVLSVEEYVDYVEFDFNGGLVKGWVWCSFFKEGDKVEVVVEWCNDYYEMVGIVRLVDCIIVLYLYCFCGKVWYIKNVVKWWIMGVVGIFVGLGGLMLGIMLLFVELLQSLLCDVFLYGFLVMIVGFYVFFGLMIFSFVKKWMLFVCLMEKVCCMLGIFDFGNVDLVKLVKV